MQPQPPRAPRISVVVPTYKRPERIERLLACLAAQTLAPSEFEVILVDDGSPEPLIVDCPSRPFACELLRQENQGPGAARNLGVERCAAPLVLFLNDDAVPPRTCSSATSPRTPKVARRSPCSARSRSRARRCASRSRACSPTATSVRLPAARRRRALAVAVLLDLQRQPAGRRIARGRRLRRAELPRGDRRGRRARLPPRPAR
jgi:hypothetical protein